MKKCLLLPLLIAALGADAIDIVDFAQKKSGKVIPGSIAVEGGDGWLYSRNELDFLMAGELMPPNILKTSKAGNKANADPLPAIVDFDQSLKKLGIELILVPVPPKLAIYPTPELKEGDASVNLRKLYAALQAKGVNVLDLTDAFISAKDKNVYCKTDSHWSPAGIGIAAAEIAAQIKIMGDSKFESSIHKLNITGDLSLSAKLGLQENVEIKSVKGKVFSDKSPVLLLTDSHGLVFSAGGDMLATDSGIAENLALILCVPVERISIKGSASTSVRINLYRKATSDNKWLKNKKYIVWIFTCREFSESGNGWVKIPIMK